MKCGYLKVLGYYNTIESFVWFVRLYEKIIHNHFLIAPAWICTLCIVR